MVRVKYSLLVKLFAIGFFALYVVPSLLKLFNSSPSQLDESSYKELGVVDYHQEQPNKKNRIAVREF
jgi:hypothetical protein